MKNVSIAIAIVCAAFVILFVAEHQRHQTPAPAPALDGSPTATAPQASSTAPAQNDEDSIEISAPAPNSLAHSPLMIAGRAKNAWYFEGQFPVELLDSAGNVLATGSAQAGSDWTAPGFVPFSLSIAFTPPATSSTGMLVFKNDNPSGDPSRDVIFAIPVRFQ